jgi:hypothetical protein
VVQRLLDLVPAIIIITTTTTIIIIITITTTIIIIIPVVVFIVQSSTSTEALAMLLNLEGAIIRYCTVKMIWCCIQAMR